jgi:hypothetical protein
MTLGNKVSQVSIMEKIKLHAAFWRKESVGRPLVTFHLAENFFSASTTKLPRAFLFPERK